MFFKSTHSKFMRKSRILQFSQKLLSIFLLQLTLLCLLINLHSHLIIFITITMTSSSSSSLFFRILHTLKRCNQRKLYIFQRTVLLHKRQEGVDILRNASDPSANLWQFILKDDQLLCCVVIEVVRLHSLLRNVFQPLPQAVFHEGTQVKDISRHSVRRILLPSAEDVFALFAEFHSSEHRLARVAVENGLPVVEEAAAGVANSDVETPKSCHSVEDLKDSILKRHCFKKLNKILKEIYSSDISKQRYRK